MFVLDIPCPVDGEWTMWSDWKPCSVQCGTGITVRIRECSAPIPMFGGLLCKGHDRETKECVTGISLNFASFLLKINFLYSGVIILKAFKEAFFSSVHKYLITELLFL